MDENISYEIRVAPGCTGSDPEAPDWQVCELEDGVIKRRGHLHN